MTLSGRTLGLLGAAGALAAALSACGDGEAREAGRSPASPTASSPSYDPQQQRIDDATANLTDFFSVYAPLGEGRYFSRDEAGCIAEKVVQDPGIERLQRAGVLNDELQYVIDAEPAFPRRDARALTDAVFACSDAEALLRRQSVRGIDGATEAQRACAADKLTDDLLARLFTLALQDEPLDPAVQEVARAFAPCRDA